MRRPWRIELERHMHVSELPNRSDVLREKVHQQDAAQPHHEVWQPRTLQHVTVRSRWRFAWEGSSALACRVVLPACHQQVSTGRDRAESTRRQRDQGAMLASHVQRSWTEKCHKEPEQPHKTQNCVQVGDQKSACSAPPHTCMASGVSHSHRIQWAARKVWRGTHRR